jgi:hypothetical protein
LRVWYAFDLKPVGRSGKHERWTLEMICRAEYEC